MLGLQCLECQQENPIGAQFCSRCDSRLNLKLCLHCEAINEAAWERCHNCGTDFRAQPVTELEPKTELLAQTAAPISGPAMHMPRRLVFACLVAALAGSAYYFDRERSLTPVTTDSATEPPAPAAVATVAAFPPESSASDSQAPEQVTPVAASPLTLKLDATEAPAVAESTAAAEPPAPTPAAAPKSISRAQRAPRPMSASPVAEPSGVVGANAAAPAAAAAAAPVVTKSVVAPPVAVPAPVVTAVSAAASAPTALKQTPAVSEIAQPASASSQVSSAATLPLAKAAPAASEAPGKEGDHSAIPGVTDGASNRALEGIATSLATLQYAATVGSVIDQLPKSDAAAPTPPVGQGQQAVRRQE